MVRQVDHVNDTCRGVNDFLNIKWLLIKQVCLGNHPAEFVNKDPPNVISVEFPPRFSLLLLMKLEPFCRLLDLLSVISCISCRSGALG